MTEDEWQTCLDPDVLIVAAKALKRLNARKARLFGSGCFRLVWDRIDSESVRRSVEMSDQRADRLITDRQLEEYQYPSVGNMYNVVASWLAMAAQSLARPGSDPSVVAYAVRSSTENDVYREIRRGLPCKWQADLLREVVGNLFRPVEFDSRWRTSDVLGLARAVYDDRAFGRLPILADALMDAGCNEEQVLSHCRGAGPHVRGCWAVDLVLGKE